MYSGHRSIRLLKDTWYTGCTGAKVVIGSFFCPLFFPGIFFHSRVSGASGVTTDLIIQEEQRQQQLVLLVLVVLVLVLVLVRTSTTSSTSTSTTSTTTTWYMLRTTVSWKRVENDMNVVVSDCQHVVARSERPLCRAVYRYRYFSIYRTTRYIFYIGKSSRYFCRYFSVWVFTE